MILNRKKKIIIIFIQVYIYDVWVESFQSELFIEKKKGFMSTCLVWKVFPTEHFQSMKLFS